MLRNIKVDYDKMSKRLGISKILCKILINRNINSYKAAENFINPSLNALHDPNLMKDINKATNIVKSKILQAKKIRIIGDYDVDGVVSTYILYTSLCKLGACVDYYLPDRIKDGYGINKNIIEEANKDGIDTIITCDNGISAIEQIKYAKQLNMTVIILDHHDIPFVENSCGNKEFMLPEADAIVNPKQVDCKYPFKNLCGAGVCLKFVQVLNSKFDIKEDEAKRLVEFAAIATVCDVVDLVDENRIIVKNGLEMINNTQNIGLKALIKYSKLENKKINVYSLGFIIGPCINACGRLSTAKKGLQLLLSKTEEEANMLAEELTNLNRERKDMTLKGVKLAEKQIEQTNMKKNKVFVIYLPNIHESIAGIIAGKIKDKYHVPTLILTKSKDGVKGSGRSIDEYNMFEELTKCSNLLSKFGGHPLAAGLSMKESNIPLLSKELNRKTKLTEEDLVPKIYIDVALPIKDVSLSLAQELEKLEPYGKGNSRPLFGDKHIKISRASILGNNKNVLKLYLIINSHQTVESIYFGDIDSFLDKVREKYGQSELDKMFQGEPNNIKIDIIYTININEYMGNKKLQLQIKSFRIC